MDKNVKDIRTLKDKDYVSDEEIVGVVSEGQMRKTSKSASANTEPQEFGEDIAQREETKRVIRIEGGRQKLMYSTVAEQFVGKNGEWQDTDNSLEFKQAEKEDDFNGYENKNNSFKVRFSNNAKQGILMRLRAYDSQIDIRLKERCRTASGRLSSRKGKVVNYEKSGVAVSEKKKKFACGKIRFQKVIADADLVYNVEGDKIKESIIIEEKRNEYRYEFCIETKNAELILEEAGAIGIYNGSKKLFSIPEAYMEDKNGEVSNEIKYELEKESDGHYHFTIVADSKWLNEDDRKFPVTLDPTLTMVNAYITSRCVGKTTTSVIGPTTSTCHLKTNYATSTTLKVGKRGDTIYRTYLNFSLGDISEHEITNVVLALNLEENGSGEFFVARATEQSMTTTDFVGKTAARDILTFDSEKNATADITTILRDWVKGEANYGLELYGDESISKDITITSAALVITCQNKKSKASNSFQKNDVRKAGSSAVDLFSGRLLFEHKDFDLSSEVLPINIAHEYNSDYYNSEVNPSMKIGKGWRLNLQQSYRAQTYTNYLTQENQSVYIFTDGNGLEHEITKKHYFLEQRRTSYDTSNRMVKRYDNDGNYSEYSSKEGLIFTSNGSYITDKSGIVNYFNLGGTEGQRLAKICANGKWLYVYYTNDKITSVQDGAGKIATFQYDTNDYLTSITCAQKTITFQYTNGCLTKISYPDNTHTTYTYEGDRLVKVTDRSGYSLKYTYIGDKVSSVEEQIANETISNTVTGKACVVSGDCWDICYLHELQTQVKNRNSLKMEYIFDVDGNTVTMFEDNRNSADSQRFSVCGKVVHKNSYIVENKDSISQALDAYKTKVETVEATLYKESNLLNAIESWTPLNFTKSSSEGPSTESYVEGGKSYKIEGSLTQSKILTTSIGPGSAEGIYVFGCWAKAENSLASIDKVYGSGNGRYFGLRIRIRTATTGSINERIYYATFDPYNTDWQMAAIAIKAKFDGTTSVYVEPMYTYNQGSVYFDNAFGAKTDGGVTYMYDSNYSETCYKNYKVVTLYDSRMNDVGNIFVKQSGITEDFVTTNTFDSCNRPLVTKNYRGVTTTRKYDRYGNLESQLTVASNNLKMLVSNEYENGNYQTKTVNSDGSATSFSYDSTDGKLGTIMLPNGQLISYEYDIMGAVKAIKANVGSVNNKNEISYQFGYITQLKHGNTTYNFAYDGYGRIKTVKAGGVTILTNEYTDFGSNINGVSGAVSKVISTDAVGNSVSTYTDKYGKIICTNRGNSSLSEELYDAADNLIKHVDFENGIKYNYSYNERGDITQYYDQHGSSLKEKVRMDCTYDSLMRPYESSYVVNGKNYKYRCQYTEYPDEELASFETPAGTVTYTRDGLSRLTEKKTATRCKTFTESYAYAANFSDSSYTTNLVSEFTFDSGSSNRSLNYGYDANGNITSVSEGIYLIASYEYDGLNRLTRENISGYKTILYAYDGGGNLTKKTEYAYTTTSARGLIGMTPTGSKRYTYASGTWGDRLISYDGEAIEYDEAGCPTTYRGKDANWKNGRLRWFDQTAFEYNDSGIRIKKDDINYYVKGNQILAEDRSGTVIHYYYDESGVMGFEYNGTKYYYRKNLQGDIIGIYDNCGYLIGEYSYDAWGKIIGQSGSEILTINPFRYRGYYYDIETGLYYLNSRYYDPETGRFISPDSVDVLNDTYMQPNGLNLYAYCYNNPVMMTDPDGAFTLTWWQKLLIGLAFITLGAIATALSGGSFAAAFVCGFNIAVKSAISGAVVGMVMGGLTAAFKGENVLEGALNGFKDGFVDGFMWGGISAGLTNIIKPGSFCFIAGTKVLTENGQKNIEDICVGDKVLAYNEETGETEYKKVVRLFRNETKEWCHVFVDGQEIISTPGHKYYLPENTYNRELNEKLEHLSYVGLTEKWVSAKNLKTGDKVLLSDGRYGVVDEVEIEKLESSEITYNFEVEDFHTYYVGAGVLVHNLDCKIHGNSLKTNKKTDLYALVDKNTGSIKKIGETTRGTARYTKKFYSENNVVMKIIDSGSKRSMHYQQNRLLHKFFDSIGRLPILNKGFW